MADRLIDRLRAGFKRQKVTILDVEVHVTPLSLAETANVQAKFPDDTARRQAEILIMKCRDANGEPVFTADDRDALATEVNGGAFTAVWAAVNGHTVDAQAEK